jgi:DNA-binding NtrC family response regulator
VNGASVLNVNYDPGLLDIREQLVSRLGYEVVSVLGSAAARRTAKTRHFDLVIIGHAAPDEERRRLAQWLKSNLPGVPVLALCPAPFQGVDYGDYQADAHNPDAWLALVQEVLGKKKA